jgi:hypothetical protein
MRQLIIAGISLAAICLSSPASTRVERIEILSRQAFAAGTEFGHAGSYEKLRGRAFFALDPDLRRMDRLPISSWRRACTAYPVASEGASDAVLTERDRPDGERWTIPRSELPPPMSSLDVFCCLRTSMRWWRKRVPFTIASWRMTRPIGDATICSAVKPQRREVSTILVLNGKR